MEEIIQVADDLSLSTFIYEVNLIGSNSKEWWNDTSVICHMCSDRSLFTSFELIEKGEKLLIGKFATFDIQGKGKVILHMISGKTLTLNNILYVPEIQKNLMSGSPLSKHGFRMVFEYDKVVLSKSRMFLGKVYVSNSYFS